MVVTARPSYGAQSWPVHDFVYGIAAHKVADAHRSAARNRAEPVLEIPDTQNLADGPDAQVMQVELTERRTKLPDKQRDILVLRVVVGLSAEETAEVVSSAPGAVRVAQHRVLSRLRNILASMKYSNHGVRAGIRSTEVTGKVTRHPVRFTEWMAEKFEDDRITVADQTDLATMGA